MNLGSLFFKVEEVPDSKTPVKPVVSAPAVAPIAGLPGQEDAEIKKQLLDALDKANLPGYDYFEFAKAIDAQANLIPSEELRFKSTFAVAVASDPKINTGFLISTAQKYLDVLKQEESKFSGAVDEHSRESVTIKEEDAKKLDADMQAKAEQIKAITEEINAMQQKKTALVNDISSAKAKIDSVRNNFQATLQFIVKKISSDIDKIKQYLGGN